MAGTANKIAQLILAKHRSEGGAVDKDKGDRAGIDAAVEQLIDAVHSKNSGAAVEALRSAFQQLESEPHEEA